MQYEKELSDLLLLFSHLKSQYMVKSLLFRKQGKVDVGVDSAMITWGPSLILGGKLSDVICEELNNALLNSNSPRYVYPPDGEWKFYIESAFSNHLVKKQIHLYQHSGLIEMDCMAEHSIVQTTETFFQHALLNTQVIKDEIYSYSTVEDFLQNGFGLALVIDENVCGYCLSEYSIDNECAINIWIDEKYRRLGFAKKMTLLFLQHAKKENWKTFWACASDNIPSNKVALSTGFDLHSKQDYFEWNSV